MALPRIRRPLMALPALFAVACTSATIGDLTGDPLNPELYRAQIVAIDAVLFEDGLLGAEGRDQVGNTLLVLAGVAESQSGNTIANTLGREMRTLAPRVKRTSVGTPLAGSQLRHQWLRIRSSLFNDAAWFRRSSADPIDPAVAGPSPPSALRPATADERVGLDQAIVTIGRLVERAKQDLPNAHESDARRQFSADAQQEVGLATDQLGLLPQGWGADNYYRAAHAAASEALRNLRMLSGLGVGAPRSSREYLIEKAEGHLRKAREKVAHMIAGR